MRINNEILRAKEQRKEEEKLADMRNMEYIKKKMVRCQTCKFSIQFSKCCFSTCTCFGFISPQYHHYNHFPLQVGCFFKLLSSSCQEREAEFEAEQRRIKKEKELEIARLRARQEKAKDYQAEQVRININIL